MKRARETTNKMLVTVYWSEAGDIQARRRAWNRCIKKKSWGGKKLKPTVDTWRVNQKIIENELMPAIQRIFKGSDRAICVYPHSSSRKAKLVMHKFNF